MEPGNAGEVGVQTAAAHELNEAMLLAAQQRRLSLRWAMTTLEVSLAARAYGRVDDWRARVEVSLWVLGECMSTHIDSTEGPAGFHEQMVIAAPRLAHAVAVSVAEHDRIRDLIAEIGAAIGMEWTGTEADVEQVRETGTALLALLARHRQRGADMIYEAYQTDLGGTG